MASIRKEIQLEAGADEVWDAVRDFGGLHERLVKGFVVGTELDGSDRIVTFANGAVQREPLVSLDDDARRLVYSAVDSPLGATHYNAAVRVFENGDAGSRVEWVVDVLPNELGAILDQVMDHGAAAMKQTLDA
jgi:hypothetical protein